MSQADPPIILGDRLRLEASLALEDYLNDLIQLGRTNDQNNHEDMERVRLQYLRLLEAAQWADGPDEEHIAAVYRGIFVSYAVAGI